MGIITRKREGMGQQKGEKVYVGGRQEPCKIEIQPEIGGRGS